MPTLTSIHRVSPILRDLLAQVLIAAAVGIAASVMLAGGVMLLAYLAQPAAGEAPPARPVESRT